MQKKYLIKIIVILLLPIFFYIGVRCIVGFNHHSICLFKLITGHECWGCGMTRAFDAVKEQQHSSSPHKIKTGLRKLSPFLSGGGGIRTHFYNFRNLL